MRYKYVLLWSSKYTFRPLEPSCVPLCEVLLVEQTKRIFFVGAEWWNTLKSHPLEFPIRGANQFDAAAASRHTVRTDQEKGHGLRNQLVDTQTVAAFGRIAGRKMRLKFHNEGNGVGGVRTLCRD